MLAAGIKPAPTSNSRNASNTRHLKSESAGANYTQTPTADSTKMQTLTRLGKNHKIKDLQTGPGPGAYYRELEIGGVSYGIGKAKRVRERKQLSVGPGAYDLPPTPIGLGYSMTPRRKQLKKIENIPGPGTYTPTSEKKCVVFSVPKADRNKSRIIESPGPGAYTISRQNSSRSAL